MMTDTHTHTHTLKHTHTHTHTYTHTHTHTHLSWVIQKLTLALQHRCLVFFLCSCYLICLNALLLLCTHLSSSVKVSLETIFLPYICWCGALQELKLRHKSWFVSTFFFTPHGTVSSDGLLYINFHFTFQNLLPFDIKWKISDVPMTFDLKFAFCDFLVILMT